MSMTATPLPIQAITFDLDDTLWDVWSVVAKAEQRLHDWLEEHYPLIPERYTALELRALCGEIAREQPAIAHDRTRLRKQALARAAQLCRYADFCADSAFAIFYAARNEVVFFEEVLPVLERLARRYRLGALSNGNADIHLVGLGEVFDFALNAADVGTAKPERAMFDAACRYLELAPAQIVHVGDDPEHDVLGATQAGFRTVWVNRNGRDWPAQLPRAEAEIKTLEELELVLAQWLRVAK